MSNGTAGLVSDQVIVGIEDLGDDGPFSGRAGRDRPCVGGRGRELLLDPSSSGDTLFDPLLPFFFGGRRVVGLPTSPVESDVTGEVLVECLRLEGDLPAMVEETLSGSKRESDSTHAAPEVEV